MQLFYSIVHNAAQKTYQKKKALCLGADSAEGETQFVPLASWLEVVRALQVAFPPMSIAQNTYPFLAYFHGRC